MSYVANYGTDIFKVRKARVQDGGCQVEGCHGRPVLKMTIGRAHPRLCAEHAWQITNEIRGELRGRHTRNRPPKKHT